MKPNHRRLSPLVAVLFLPSYTVIAGDDAVELFEPCKDTWNLRGVLRAHKENVNSTMFSPDGSKFVTASDDRTARIWDVKTGTVTAVLQGHRDRVNIAAWSADGKRIVTGSGDFFKPVVPPSLLEFVPEVTLKPAKPNEQFSMTEASFSPDQTRLLTSTYHDGARVWNAQTGEPILFLNHEKGGHHAAWSADGKRIVTGGQDGSVKVWDATNGACVLTFTAQAEKRVFAILSPDGTKIATLIENQNPALWNAADGKLIREFSITTKRHNYEDFEPVSGRPVKRVYEQKFYDVWDAESGASICVMKNADRSSAEIGSLAFSPDGKRLVAGGQSVVFSADGKTVATAQAKAIQLFDAQTGELGRTLNGHEQWINRIAVSASGSRLASAGRDSTIRIWDFASGECLGTFHDGVITEGAALSADGERLFICGRGMFALKKKDAPGGGADSSVRIWDAASGTCLVTIDNAHTRAVFRASFSADGKFVVSSGGDDAVKVWDAVSGKEVKRFEAESARNGCLSPDGKMLALVSGNKAKLFDFQSQKLLFEFGDEDKISISDVAFSPDSKRIVTNGADTGGDYLRTIRVWNLQSGKSIAVIKPPKEEEIYRVSFSPDGRRVLSGHSDGCARIWDVSTGKCVTRFKTYHGAVMNPAFSADGDWLIFSNHFRQIILWQRTKVAEVEGDF